MDSLPLFHSWPLYDAAAKLGVALCGEVADAPKSSLGKGAFGLGAGPVDGCAARGLGIWTCNLADERLRWTPAVHRLFGLPEDEPVTRAFTVSRYVEGSRRAMETLRAYAIEHRRGFTLDARIRRVDGDLRWMRLSAMPILRAGKVVRLTGTKQDVTAEYDGPGWRGF